MQFLVCIWGAHRKFPVLICCIHASELKLLRAVAWSAQTKRAKFCPILNLPSYVTISWTKTICKLPKNKVKIFTVENLHPYLSSATKTLKNICECWNLQQWFRWWWALIKPALKRIGKVAPEKRAATHASQNQNSLIFITLAINSGRAPPA